MDPATTYPDSASSSPRSRSDSFDDPFPSTNSSKLRLMCSYGGRIVPRPTDKSLCYLGGDTRILLLDRSSTFQDLLLKLRSLLSLTTFSLKYQLPNEDLDALISLSSDEDLENMIDEYDRIASSGKSSSSRIRLFVFSGNIETNSRGSIGSLLDDSKSETWFVDALNGSGIGVDGTSNLIGFDDRPESFGRLDRDSSFGSTNSGLNLPPIRVRAATAEDRGNGVEEQFKQMNISRSQDPSAENMYTNRGVYGSDDGKIDARKQMMQQQQVKLAPVEAPISDARPMYYEERMPQPSVPLNLEPKHEIPLIDPPVTYRMQQAPVSESGYTMPTNFVQQSQPQSQPPQQQFIPANPQTVPAPQQSQPQIQQQFIPVNQQTIPAPQQSQPQSQQQQFIPTNPQGIPTTQQSQNQPQQPQFIPVNQQTIPPPQQAQPQQQQQQQQFIPTNLPSVPSSHQSQAQPQQHQFIPANPQTVPAPQQSQAHHQQQQFIPLNPQTISTQQSQPQNQQQQFVPANAQNVPTPQQSQTQPQHQPQQQQFIPANPQTIPAPQQSQPQSQQQQQYIPVNSQTFPSSQQSQPQIQQQQFIPANSQYVPVQSYYQMPIPQSHQIQQSQAYDPSIPMYYVQMRQNPQPISGQVPKAAPKAEMQPNIYRTAAPQASAGHVEQGHGQYTSMGYHVVHHPSQVQGNAPTVYYTQAPTMPAQYQNVMSDAGQQSMEMKQNRAS